MDTPSNARFYEICEKHHVTKVLGAPDAAAHAAQVRRRARRRPPAARPASWSPSRASRSTGTRSPGRARHLGGGVPGGQRLRADRDRLHLGLPGRRGRRRSSPARPARPVPGHVFDIVDDDGRAGAAGHQGQPRCSPSRSRRWRGPSGTTRSATSDAYFSRFPGSYCTNDEAVLDADGHLWVLGRADDVINVAAHRISTLEIEADRDRASRRSPRPPSSGCPTRPRAPCRSRSSPCSTAPTRARVRQEVARTASTAQLGGYARLGAVYLTAALPKTRTGKIMRRLLRDVVDARRPAGRHQRHGGPGRRCGPCSRRSRPTAAPACEAAAGLWFEQLEPGLRVRARHHAAPSPRPTTCCSRP